MVAGLRNPHPSSTSTTSRPLLTALAVYAEGLVVGARALVLGGAPDLEELLRDLGARSVYVHDGDPAALDVRDGAFDLAVIGDIGRLSDPAGTVRRLRRLVDARGAVVALARAVTGPSAIAEGARGEATPAAFPELAPAAIGYAQLYDLFALQFDAVTMGGVLPFSGVVFAELGEAEDPAVSVDTRLAPAAAPEVFVVVASRDARDLDPYAIVQTSAPAARAPARDVARDRESGPALAAAQLKSELLAAQLDEVRARLTVAEARSESRPSLPDESLVERRQVARRLEELAAERDAAVARIAELGGVLAAAQQALGVLEQRLVLAEQQMLERDDRLAALRGELDALRSDGVDLAMQDPQLVAELAARTERAEAALALHVADIAQVVESHALETAALEAQLRERARAVAAMEKELARRDQLVRELVSSLEEAREHGILAMPMSPPLPAGDPDELARLRRKLDELALEVARREGELVAQQWRIDELERAAAPSTASASAEPGQPPRPAPASDLESELARTRDELDALRQALTQEHAARVAAESGEELARARAELARQATLLEQMRAASSHPGR